MPLITAAYLAIAAGLLLGFGGEAFWGLALAPLAAAAAISRRDAAPLALGSLMAAAALLAASLARSDAACARDIATAGRATVRLSEELRGGRAARGETVGSGCRVRVRVSAGAGQAPAGALVDVRGVVQRDGDLVSFRGATIIVRAEAPLLARWRARAGRVIDELYGARAPLARALLIADERDIAPEVRTRFADAGIIHMLSVSGLHVAVLAEAVALALLLAGAGIRRAEVASVAVTLVFVVFVGAPAPAVRAGVMYTSVLATRRLQRPTSPWALLTLGALLPLADPRVIRDAGYQLSVVGMAGLIASGMVVRRMAFRHWPAWTRRASREVLATCVASAVTAPVVAWHFGRVSLAAPVTNLAAAPLFGLAQPALFLSLACAPMRPVARFVADATSVLLDAIDRVAAWGAAIPGAALDVLPSFMTALCLAAAGGALIVACASRRWARPAVAGMSSIAAALWWPIVAPSSAHLEVHMLDVGQGDAIALRTPAGRWIVVDAGDSWRTGDAGARIVAPYLRRRGGDVAALVLTHPHSDHIGGASSVLRLTSVAAVYEGGMAFGSAEYASLLEAVQRRRVAWRVARAGESLTIDGVRLFILGPDAETVTDAADPNDASVVVMAEYRGARVLLTGDAEAAEEARMLALFGPERLRADVLKVGHHGSITSSSAQFLDAVRPRVALVSVGADNSYGHPSADVIRALASRHAELLRTDEDGTVVLITDGQAWRVRTDDGTWVLQAGSTPR